MQYTLKLFIEFLEKLIEFDSDLRSAEETLSQARLEQSNREKNEWHTLQFLSQQEAKKYVLRIDSFLSNTRDEIRNILNCNLSDKAVYFTRIQKCKEILALIRGLEEEIIDKTAYNACGSCNVDATYNHNNITVDMLLQGDFDFVAMADAVNDALQSGDRQRLVAICSNFYNTCRAAEVVLSSDIFRCRAIIMEDFSSLLDNYTKVYSKNHEGILSMWNSGIEMLHCIACNFADKRDSIVNSTNNNEKAAVDEFKHTIKEKTENFCEIFPPKEFIEEYMRIYAAEPSYEKYDCCSEMPRDIHLGTIEYSLSKSSIKLSAYTQALLNRFYPFIYRGDKLCFPYSITLNSGFNYLFRFTDRGRQHVVNDACELGMRLFMMLPPGKLNFTFVDPVRLGESFAVFTRLVEIDGRTSKVINGKVWSSPTDIESKLKIMTDHISNVTQRCLQGKYGSIYEYNIIADQNAEAYQVLMLMDFPAGFTEQSLKLLEQIVTSGPKCGVFTIMYHNESQYKKISERSYPIIANIEASLEAFDYSNDRTYITIPNFVFRNQQFLWWKFPMPTQLQMDIIIATLKKGINNAEKVVIGIEKVHNAEMSSTTQYGIKIPIGVHGANEIQYLTLGVGGSHHALIAGVAGSGKSSLLHTIILMALTQYSSDELSIYLVDFKRGVEFKIYADFILPAFKVIAIESEREFGYNILLALEREQKIRANLFKKNNVDKIEEYRGLGKKMPRVLVIMDEFHELFSGANDDITNKSAVILERIVRQGRAFGIHLILASQSYSNVRGIDHSVFDQIGVRIALRCSKKDADLLLDDGSSEINQISFLLMTLAELFIILKAEIENIIATFVLHI